MNLYDLIASPPAATFYVKNENEVGILMNAFACFLRERIQDFNVELVQRIGFFGNPNSGKTTSVKALFNNLGEQEIYDHRLDKSQRRPQSLRYSEDVGWIRHFDMCINTNKLPAASDLDFWDVHACGIDLVEHINGGYNDDVDFLFELHVTDRGVRTIKLHSDPNSVSTDLLLKYIRQAHEDIERSRIYPQNDIGLPA